MGGDCFQCGRAASKQYTLILEQPRVLKDTVICEGSVGELRNVDWIGLYPPGETSGNARPDSE